MRRLAVGFLILGSCAAGVRDYWVYDLLYGEEYRALDRRRQIEVLVGLLGHPEEEAARIASEELLRHGAEAHEALLTAAKYRLGDPAARAIRVYAQSGTAEALLEAWPRMSDGAKPEAAAAICRLGGAEHATRFLSAYPLEPAAVRAAMLRTLTSWRAAECLPVLADAIHDPLTADAGVDGLVVFRAEAPLRAQWRRADAPARARILRALARMRAGRDLAVAALADASAEVRIAAAGAVAREDAGRLLPVLEDPSWSVFLAAHESLGRLTGQPTPLGEGEPEEIRRRSQEHWSRFVPRSSP